MYTGFSETNPLFSVDLAAEASDLLRGTRRAELPGITESIHDIGQITIREIQIQTEEGSQLLQRPQGTYITLESPPLQINDPAVQKNAVQALAEALPRLIEEKITLKENDCILCVGLGNREAAADALGPYFASRCPVTRHYSQYAPGALAPHMRPCCVLAPGVLGTTGVETLDIIKGVVKQIHPALVIAVDSLSAQNIERIGCTIQLSNNGIRPGGGLGSRRQTLDETSLGVPVIAAGCPTIVSANVIAKQILETYGRKSNVPIDPQTEETVIKNCFSFYETHLSVTPKDIESIISHAADIIARGISQALFPRVSPEQMSLYTAHR